MILPASYANGFAPRDGEPLYPELWKGCVGAWSPCIGPTGLALRDWSGFGNHGTLTNMDAGTDWVTSQGRYALDFDGLDDIVTTAGVSQLNSLAAGTVAFWAQKAASNKDAVVGSRVASTNGMWLQWYTDGILYWTVRNGGVNFVSSAVTFTSEWLHFAGVFSGASGRLYVNGREVATGTTATLSATAGSQWSVGGLSGGFFATSKQDDVRIYNRALSLNEIRLLATRRGIAHELAPVRYAGESLAAYTRRLQHAQLIGGGLIG